MYVHTAQIYTENADTLRNLDKTRQLGYKRAGWASSLKDWKLLTQVTLKDPVPLE